MLQILRGRLWVNDDKLDADCFLFEIDRGRTRETFIHIETKTIFNDDEYILDKMTQIQKYYDPQMIEVEISPLGKWEYNALKEKGLKSLFENVV